MYFLRVCKIRRAFLSALMLATCLAPLHALASLDWAKLRTNVKQEKWAEVINELSNVHLNKLSANDRELRQFALGVFRYKSGQLYEAKSHLEQYLTFRARLNGMAHYYLAEISAKLGRRNQSYMHYLNVVTSDVSRHFKTNAKYQLGLYEYQRKNYRTAYRYFKNVEKKWRGDSRHADSVWQLMLTEFSRKRSWRACIWARKIYSKYPGYELASTWNLDLTKAKVANKKINCFVTMEHQTQRMRRWIWAGTPLKAFNEIEEWSKTSKAGKFYNDMLWANFNSYEGNAERAKQILLPHYKVHAKNHQYLKLLAKVSEMQGNYNAAVGLYQKAYQVKSRSKAGRASLFKAAFISYQNQDYDMAIRLLSEVTKRHRRSGLTRDAKWYLGWIKYLKNDYEGSVAEFKSILTAKKRYRRRWASVPSDKINYWLAMSYYKQGKVADAGKIFASIAKSKSRNYYTQAAGFRLKKIKPDFDKALEEISRTVASSEDDLKDEAQVKKQMQESNEEDESFNDSIQQEVEPEQFFNVLIDAEGNDDDEQVTVSTIQDPKIKERFQRVQDLVRLGLNFDARWEMYEIERRTRNEQYNKALIGTYNGIGALHRSGRVAALSFARHRQKHGIEGIRYLWQHAYPLAYEDVVGEASTAFNVDKYFVLSIIRAESFYKPNIDSPVGAKGLMQIMPNTGLKISELIGEGVFEVESLYQPEVNIRLGTRYLRRLLTQFEGKIPLAAAGYNAGPHRVNNWVRSFGELEMDEFIEHIPYRETRNYVKKVTKNFGVYHELYEGNTAVTSYLSQPVGVRRPTEKTLKENWSAL